MPIQDFSAKYVLMQSAMAASERLFALMDSKGEIQIVIKNLNVSFYLNLSLLGINTELPPTPLSRHS